MDERGTKQGMLAWPVTISAYLLVFMGSSYLICTVTGRKASQSTRRNEDMGRPLCDKRPAKTL